MVPGVMWCDQVTQGHGEVGTTVRFDTMVKLDLGMVLKTMVRFGIMVMSRLTANSFSRLSLFPMFFRSKVRLKVNVTPLRRRNSLLDIISLRHRVRLGRLRERAALPRPLLLRLFSRRSGGNCIKIALPGKSILRDHFSRE